MQLLRNYSVSLLILLGLAACAPASESPDPVAQGTSSTDRTSMAQGKPDPLNATYVIDGQPVTLVDGQVEHPVAPDSAMTERVYVWGEPVYGDLDGDGDGDAIVVLVQQTGGSGTFVYVAAAVQKAGRYTGSEAVFLGDRIDMPLATIDHGILQVRFLDRPSEASFAEAPTVKRVLRAKLEGKKLRSL